MRFDSCLTAFALAAAALCVAAAPLVAAEPALPTTPVDTVIESKGPLEMVSTETTSTFTFSDEVVITATNLRLTCDKLVVVTRRAYRRNASISGDKSPDRGAAEPARRREPRCGCVEAAGWRSLL